MAGSALNHRAFLGASWALLVLIGLVAVYVAALGRWLEATVLMGFVALAIAFLAARQRLPRVFTFLFLSAGVLNMIGYLFDLWYDPVWFDEAVHAWTSFAGMAAIGWLLVVRTDLEDAPHGWKLILAVIAIGLALGLLWEGFEWAIGIIDSPLDTRRDLVMDALGAVGAGLWCAWVAGRLGSARAVNSLDLA